MFSGNKIADILVLDRLEQTFGYVTRLDKPVVTFQCATSWGRDGIESRSEGEEGKRKGEAFELGLNVRWVVRDNMKPSYMYLWDAPPLQALDDDRIDRWSCPLPYPSLCLFERRIHRPPSPHPPYTIRSPPLQPFPPHLPRPGRVYPVSLHFHLSPLPFIWALLGTRGQRPRIHGRLVTEGSGSV